MKISAYSSFVRLNSKYTLAYGAFLDKFLILPADFNKDKINVLIENRKLNTELFQKFIDSGIFVPKESDEYLQLKERINAATSNTVLRIHVNPTIDCNFNCWYCYEKHRTNTKMSLELINAISLFIKKYIGIHSKLTEISLEFFGGEPLMYFNDCAKRLITNISHIATDNAKGFSIHFTSNGSLLTPEITKFLSQYTSGFQITLDGNGPTHDKTRFYQGGIGSYDTIISNLKELLDNNIKCLLRINYTSITLESCASILQDLKNAGIINYDNLCIDLQRVWQDRPTTVDDIEDEANLVRELFSNNGYHVLHNNINHSIDFPCYGDMKHHFLINYNGDVFGCTARDFTSKNKIGVLRNNGHMELNDNYHIRKNSKFARKECHLCRIAPICGGGCSQRSFETPDTGTCLLGYSDNDMDEIILNRFDYLFCHK